MSQHNISVSLRHMLDHALEAVAMTKGKTRDVLKLIVKKSDKLKSIQEVGFTPSESEMQKASDKQPLVAKPKNTDTGTIPFSFG